MKKMINTATVGGKLYAVNLEEKVSKKNVRYINGDISIATNPEMSNIIKITYVYVPETQKNFSLFKKLVDGDYSTVETDGAENATNILVRGSSVALNEFINRNNELVSVKRLEGGIPTLISNAVEAEYKNDFDIDMIVTNVRILDGMGEESDKAIIKGACFNFRNDILPMEFVVKDSSGIDFFTSLGISTTNPYFIKLHGKQISQTYEQRSEEPTAFGEPIVKISRRNVKEFEIISSAAEPYEWDSEETILAKEVSEKSAERELRLATLKKSHEEYMASKGTTELFGLVPPSNKIIF